MSDTLSELENTVFIAWRVGGIIGRKSKREREKGMGGSIFTGIKSVIGDPH